MTRLARFTIAALVAANCILLCIVLTERLHPESKARSTRDTGFLSAMDPATIQGVTRRLKARGLITGRADPKDGRRILLRLSAKGARLAKVVIPEGIAVSDGILEPLSDRERKQFLRLLKQLT